ncbi:MAG TPA: flagellar basal body rod C-terminal domain-containing protein, partial [Rhodanobacter sp.]|nr:flagellar basal body rod C-terminal domain-containing protein [Rhodanobacter sp.]
SVPLTANPDGTLSAEGLTFSVSGSAQVGDSFEIRPTQNAASGIAMATTNPSAIAASAALAATPGNTNTGAASVGSVTVADSANPALFTPATVTFGAGNTYSVNGGASQAFTPGQPITFNGWSLALSGTPAVGDTFAVGRNSAGLNDNTNALDLTNLANAGTLDGGTLSATGAYAALTNQIGLAGSMASNDLATQTGLFNQATSAQQSAAGVNLDEEAANLVKYQQSYQASAQVIATAQTLFASLITAIQA